MDKLLARDATSAASSSFAAINVRVQPLSVGWTFRKSNEDSRDRQGYRIPSCDLSQAFWAESPAIVATVVGIDAVLTGYLSTRVARAIQPAVSRESRNKKLCCQISGRRIDEVRPSNHRKREDAGVDALPFA